MTLDKVGYVLVVPGVVVLVRDVVAGATGDMREFLVGAGLVALGLTLALGRERKAPPRG
jgi:hypothetical protein